MPSEPRWLTVDHAKEFNRLAVATTGEPFAVKHIGLLESAMASPMDRWHYGEHYLAVLAAGLLLSIARNHPFLQGNKRAALLVADAFLAINDWRLLYPDEGLADLIVAAIERTIDEAEFTRRFRDGCGRKHP